MAVKTVYGLKSILIGDIAVDGGMGTTLTELFGATVKDSAKLTSTEATLEDIPIEESSTPIDSIQTNDPVFTLEASTYNVELEVLAKLFGGAVTGTAPNETYTPPVGMPSVILEQSVKVETKGGTKFMFVRMKLTAALDLGFKKSGLGQINWKGKMLESTKALTPPFTVTTGTGAP